MRKLLLFSLLLALSTNVFAQARRTQPPAQPAGRAGMAITVTTAQGATLPGVQVQAIGATERNGQTDASGQVNFPGLAPGTYRLRFSGESVLGFEREVTLRAGQIADLDIVLTLAPAQKPAAAAPPPPPPSPPLGPAGAPQVLSVVDLVERELIANSVPRKDTLIACSGNTRTTLVQLNQPQPERNYEDAEVVYYVVAGEGAVSLRGKDLAVAAGAYLSLPRGTAHAITRRGRRPLILLAVLSGEPCEQAR